MTNDDNQPSYTQSNLGRAIDSHSIDAIQKLDKSETAFYLCDVLGVEPPEEHPSEYNGIISRSLSQQFALVLADYADRNGTEAFHAEDVLSDENNEDDSESDNDADSDSDE